MYLELSMKIMPLPHLLDKERLIKGSFYFLVLRYFTFLFIITSIRGRDSMHSMASM